MELKEAYQKLFTVPGYTFIVDRDGTVNDWNASQLERVVHLVPGSFNPLHESHQEIYNCAYAPYHMTAFEMSVERVDKEMVSLDDLSRRVVQFKGNSVCVVSRAPRFIEKIGLYKRYCDDLVFHVGIDCITRMKDDYGLWGIQGLAADFVVHDRIMNGRLMSLETEFSNNIPMNCRWSGLIRSPESLTRSSSQIRRESGEK